MQIMEILTLPFMTNLCGYCQLWKLATICSLCSSMNFDHVELAPLVWELLAVVQNGLRPMFGQLTMLKLAPLGVALAIHVAFVQV